MKRFFKSFIVTLLLIVVFFVGSTVYFLFKNHIENPGDMISELKNSDKNVEFLLLGVDSLDSSKAESARSDTIMVVSMDLETGNANLMSIPRDTYAKIEGYNNQKINHSYNYGGSELTLKTVNTLLGTNIPYYITMDYSFVEDIVDIIGGVTVDVPVKMDYEDPWADPPLSIHLESGVQNLNGNQALQFLRFRKGYANQDLGRVQAQQQFVSAFIEKVKSPSTMIKGPMLLKSYDRYTESNMPFSQVVKIGINVRKFSTDNISTDTLPGYPRYQGGVSYFFIDQKKTDSILQSMGLK